MYGETPAGHKHERKIKHEEGQNKIHYKKKDECLMDGWMRIWMDGLTVFKPINASGCGLAAQMWADQ